ncbi:hypothetical protein L209DRAFT_781310 [Thermothelomyces heterothallicus CBS 203.75]
MAADFSNHLTTANLSTRRLIWPYLRYCVGLRAVAHLRASYSAGGIKSSPLVVFLRVPKHYPVESKASYGKTQVGTKTYKAVPGVWSYIVLSAPGRIEAACKLSKGMAELGLMELPAKLGLPAARTRFDELQAIYQLQAYATHYAQRCLESAGDPLFYPHHTWLDKVFWGWQARDSSTGTTTIGGTNIASDAPPGFLTRPSNIPLRAYWCRRRPWHNTTLGHVLNMYGNMPNATVGDVLDIQGDFLCYEYVEPEDEATSPAWSEPELGRDQKKDDDSEPRGAKEPNSLCEGAFQRFLTDFLKSAESAKWPCSINAPGKSGMRKERMELGRGTCRFRRETVEKMGY